MSNSAPTKDEILKVLRAAAELGLIIVETVKEAGPLGAPAGHLYAAVMSVGIDLNTFQRIMSALVDAGRLKLSNNVYTFVR
jgi:hypothetical protein